MNGFSNLGRVWAGIVGFGRAPRPAEPVPAVLLLGAAGAAPLPQPPGWRLLAAGSLWHARRLLEKHEIPVVLCDRDAPGLDWRTAVAVLAASPCRPRVVLLTSVQESELWEQVTAAGGYDVLRKPAALGALERVLEAGFSHWRSSRALEAGRPPAPVRR